MQAHHKLMPGKDTASVARRAGIAMPALRWRFTPAVGLAANSHGNDGAGDHALYSAVAGKGGARVI